VKRYVQELGTAWVNELFESDELLACATLGFVEVCAALARKGKAGELSADEVEAHTGEVEQDWRDFIQIEFTTELVISAAGRARQVALRGAGAVHLASAEALRRELAGTDSDIEVVTSDHELKAAVQASGMRVVDPEESGNEGE